MTGARPGDIAEHGGDPCLVMEYLPSRSQQRELHDSLAEQELARSRSDVANGIVRPGDPAEPYALAWRRIRSQLAGQNLA